MNILLGLIVDIATGRIADRVSHEIKRGVSPLAPYLRRLAIGATLLISSALLWFTCFTFLMLGLFFGIASVRTYVAPALWTSLVTGLIALWMSVGGLGMLRKPRP